MRHFSEYDSATGEFTGRTYSASCPTESEVVANARPGGALIEGLYHRDSHRVAFDGNVTAVVERQAPAPDSDHEWNVELKRWQKRADVERRESRAKIAQHRIDDLERKQLRAIREATLGDQAAEARLRAIDQEIAALRAELSDRPR